MTHGPLFARTYGVELLCDARPTLRKRDLLAALRGRCPAARPLDGDEDSELLCFAHDDHLVHYTDGWAPAQTFVAVADAPLKSGEYASAVEQSWSFEEAAEVATRCRSSVLVTDLMASGLDHRQRLKLFADALVAVLDVVACEAIAWKPSGCLVDPKVFRSSHAAGQAAVLVTGPVNVRLYRLAGAADEMLVDTLGLGALGLTDLQCHFRSLDPNEVAKLLYDTSLYLFENGDVIEDGQDVPGRPVGATWRAQRDESMAEPARSVLDLVPGEAFAGHGV